MGGTINAMSARNRIILYWAFSATAFDAGAVRCQGQDVPRKSDGTRSVTTARNNAELMAPARPAIEKGLKYLATRQQEDGAFSNSGYGRNAAVVALAGISWLAGGNTPGRGPFGTEVGKVSEYLL